MSHDRAATVALLAKDEGFKPYVYKDHLGFDTLGHGILVDKRKGGGITVQESLYLVENRVGRVEAAFDKAIPWWRDMSPARCTALTCMGYQLGAEGVLGFKKMIAALQAGDYATASDEALDSKWAREDTPARAARMAAMLRKG